MYDITPIKHFARYYLDHGSDLSHDDQFKEAGYYGIEMSSAREWNKVHQWLQTHYYNRYTWTGGTFWFDDARIATEFALRWG